MSIPIRDDPDATPLVPFGGDLGALADLAATAINGLWFVVDGETGRVLSAHRTYRAAELAGYEWQRQTGRVPAYEHRKPQPSDPQLPGPGELQPALTAITKHYLRANLEQQAAEPKAKRKYKKRRRRSEPL